MVRFLSGWGTWIRTEEMSDSESDALPLGYTPIIYYIIEPFFQEVKEKYMKIRTRFAPSPTGYMHIGNLRTALYCYLIAKHDLSLIHI